MATIVIEGKEHTCSKRVEEEVTWLRIQVDTAIALAKKIEDQQDELLSEINKRNEKIQGLIKQLKDL
jgi:hypothetical protein